MKTNITKILLVALSLVLILSLFACNGDRNETDAPAGNESTEAIDNETTAAVGGETEETTGAPCTHTEETVAAVAPTCTETGLTEGKKCADCGEILVAQETVAALGHTEETIEAVPSTCTEAGLTEGKKCAVCGEILAAQEATAALGHAPEAVEAVTATCIAGGNEAYAVCSCGAMCDADGNAIEAIPETPIDPENHVDTKTAYEAKAPTCGTEGNEAYAACACGAIFDAEGNKLDAIPTIPADTENHGEIATFDPIFPTTAEAGATEKYSKCSVCGTMWNTAGEEIEVEPSSPAIVPQSEVYYGVLELAALTVETGTKTSQFAQPEMSADRSYVRFARTGSSADCYVMLINNANAAPSGQYMVFKYRTDKESSVEIWANTTQHGHSGGQSKFNRNLIADGEWHIAIIDLSSDISAFVQPDASGQYAIKWARMDLLNAQRDSGYIDLAYIIYCDDPSEIEFALQPGDLELCPHINASNTAPVNNGDNHTYTCLACGATFEEEHAASGEAVWDAAEGAYVGTCVCGSSIKSYFRYQREALVDGAAVRMNVTEGVDEDGTTYTRYTHTGEKKDDGSYYDSYAMAFHKGVAGSGQYMMIRYRVTSVSSEISLGDCFGASVGSGKLVAVDGNQKIGVIGKLVADGEWHYLIFDINMKNTKDMTADENGNVDLNFLRISFTNELAEVGGTGHNYLDIDFVAFATELSALENYAAAN